jgi:hypothetical protein
LEKPLGTLLQNVGIWLVGLPWALAQGTQPLTVGQNQMTPVSQEVRLIEEDSLPVDPSLQSSNRPAGDDLSRKPSADSDPHKKSRDAAMAAYADDAKAKDNGMKLYRFTLAPKETLTTQITSDAAEVVTQRFGLLSGPTFTPSAASKGQIARVNRLSRQQRSTKIEFKNPEDRPFPLLLIVYGQVGHPYKIQILRNLSK